MGHDGIDSRLGVDETDGILLADWRSVGGWCGNQRGAQLVNLGGNPQRQGW